MADFRSDTFTAPTARMREAMARAEVGDDVFREDPTVARLEREAADFLGMQEALFVPSGTMGNQVAIHVHCRPGDELICEERSHVFVYEGGSPARLSGTQIRTLPAPRGFPAVEQLAALVRSPDDVHYPRSRLLVLENTHNMAGGTVLGPAGMEEILAEARRLGLRVHVDGARVVNAAVSSGCSVAELVRGVDSISMCLSKGMGAPVGSVLAGSHDFVAQARRARKAFGGGMRQAGVLAAPALIALEEGPALVAEDHRRARVLAEHLAAISGLCVTPPESNIVMVEVASGDPHDLCRHLEVHGVRALVVHADRLRFVTHRDLDDADVALCAQAAASWTPDAREQPR